MTAAKTLEIRNLAKTFAMAGGRRVAAVRDFSLRIEAGEFVTLLGPSGCGKTTVLRTLAGLEEADTGEVLLDGRPIHALPAHRRRVGMVFQNYALFPHLSVFENVAYSLRIRRTANEAVGKAVAAALAAVGLDEMGARLPGQLSGGQQQRVALARALVMEPDLLLFDEPLSNLDAKLRVQVRGELKRLQKRLGTTALYVTHDQDEAMSLSDRIAVINAGRLEQVATPEEIYARPATLFVAGFVGQVNALPARVLERRGDTLAVTVLGQTVEVPARDGLAGAVLAIVRPESLRLGPPRAGAHTGAVEEVEYRGDRVEYRVRLADAAVVAVEPAQGRRFAAGEPVHVELNAAAVHLLPA
ncbi:MAG: ABC transporter ATP-binding protein [Burkholderiales bacterium]|nr:ABC transporter ATP-binding protein [Burkholderiales bacterium]